MSVPDEHKAFQYAELDKIRSALKVLERAGFGPGTSPYTVLYRAQGVAMAKLGLIQPRTGTLLKILAGLSPGEIRLFQDAERGWLVEAIEKPGDVPVFKYVTDDIAEKLIKEELAPELKAWLYEPEPEYLA